MEKESAPAIVLTAAHLRLRPASADDEPFLRELFNSTRDERFAQAIYPGPLIAALLAQQFRLQRSSYAARYPDAVSYIITVDGLPIGRLLLECRDESWHIVDIALLPEHCRHGAGAAIMDGVAAAATKRNVAKLTLAVMVDNLGARRFYARLGFIEMGTAAGGAYLSLVKRLDVEPDRKRV